MDIINSFKCQERILLKMNEIYILVKVEEVLID